MTDHTNADTLRTPIVAVLGHVDHGKTSLLDTIRGSAVSEGEAGAITQHIGATDIPLDTISEMAGELIDPTDFDLPGLLFIDTPGHHSFSTLRARGGALADIAVLVVDVNDGFQPQTEEAIDILRRTGTPFVVAANKVDTTPGWNPQDGQPIQRSLEAQSERAESMLNENLYEIIGQLSDAGFSADLYWRVQDFQKNIGVVPLSAITGEGVPDLLTVLMGLSQRFMKEEMAIDVQGPGEGTVLEVKDERGFGATIDTVVYDGVVRNGDQIVVGGQRRADRHRDPGAAAAASPRRDPHGEEVREGGGGRRRCRGKDRCARPRSGDGGRAGSGRPRPPGRGGRRGGESRARGDRGGNRRERRRRQGGHARILRGDGERAPRGGGPHPAR